MKKLLKRTVKTAISLPLAIFGDLLIDGECFTRKLIAKHREQKKIDNQREEYSKLLRGE